jgi:tetratricopeptide (TPR) repeat protein
VLVFGLGVAVALGATAYLSHASIARRGGDPSPAMDAEHAALRLTARYRADTSAYSSYLRGLTLRLQFKFEASRDTLAALVDRNPLYVPGLYGLAHAWIFMALNELSDPAEAWPRVETLARRAIALDSSAANAWLALASQDEYVHHDLQRAGERLLLARRLDPLDPDVAGMRAAWFRFQGEMDSSVAEARLAHQLDPFSLMYERQLAKELYYARRYEESREAYLRLLQDSPSRLRAYNDLAQVSVAMGRPIEAVDWLRQARAAQGDSAGAAALPAGATNAEAVRLLASDARRTLARLDERVRSGQRVGPLAYARVFAALHDTSATLRWLDSMRVHGDSYLFSVRVDPAFAFVRELPEYGAWEFASGLPRLRTSMASVWR